MKSVSGSVVFEIGSGDGLYLYHAARSNPQNFYVGVDCNARPLSKLTERIYRKPSKGGVSNLLYVLASAESLPLEFSGIANEIHVLFPWGSLLRALALGEEKFLTDLRRICAADAEIEVVIGFDPQKDQQEFERLNIPELSLQFITEKLTPRYRNAGLEILKSELLSEDGWTELKTSWARRLRSNPHRSAFRVLFRTVACDPPAPQF